MTNTNKGGIGIDVVGAEELAKALEIVGPKVAVRVIKKAIGGIASDMAEVARQRAGTRKTGSLAASIRGVVKGLNGNEFGVRTVEAGLVVRAKSKANDLEFVDGLGSGSVFRDPFYWHFEEWGTANRKKPVKPYLTPTYAEFRVKFAEEFRRKVGPVLEKAFASEVRKRGLGKAK